MKLAAIVPAAGLSSRMRELKPLLPLGPQTALARVVRLFKDFGVNRVIVVTGHESDRVAAEAQAAGAETVFNPRYREGMFGSVLAGLDALPESADAFFLLPADIPLVRQAVLAALVHALGTAAGDVVAVRPGFRGAPGHPPLIGRRAWPLIRGHDGAGGLAAVLEKLGSGLLSVPVYDQGISLDMDAPGDYRAILARLPNQDIPCPAECGAFLDAMGPRGREHARAVTVRALAMARAVNAVREPDVRLDISLVRAAALLHDVAKGRPGHEVAGATLLAAWGFGRTAAVVAAHRDPVPLENPLVGERELVALADKLARGGTFMTVEERFGEKLGHFASDEEACAAIRRRLANALAVKAKIEAETGRNLYELLGMAG